MFYASFPSTKDSSWETRYNQKQTIQIIIPMPFEQFKEWDDSKPGKRGQKYKDLKKEYTEKVMNEFLTFFPQLEEFIEFTEASTPLSTKHFSSYSSGEIYGLEHSPDRFKVRGLRTQTPIKNLFLTGQDIVMVGVCGALYSGVITACAVLKKNLFTKIINGNP